jgi:FAD/FMN-containing dehydrogenase
MGCLNRFVAFDTATGSVTCEAGVTIGEVLDVAVPRGWLPPVIPGTACATIGGCLACDVHGKNHHAVGSFAQHVTGVTLLTANGQIVTCGPDREPDLFRATSGGMGLTGIILDVTLRLQRVETGSIIVRNVVTSNLEDTFRKIDEHAQAAYSVAWIDAGNGRSSDSRGIVMLGEHAQVSDLPIEQRATPFERAASSYRSIPPGLSVPLLAWRWSVSMLNDRLYGRYKAQGDRATAVPAKRYFFPLDAVQNWNRLTGSRGFFEYQVVFPEARAFDTVTQMLALMRERGAMSFLTSIKRLGPSAPGHLSFPQPGYAFSFDLPASTPDAMTLLDRCDELTIAAGGRVCLAKDARLRAEAFAAMYPRSAEWQAIARLHDPAGMLSSSMSRRLGLTS